jgi:hypothetical protein
MKNPSPSSLPWTPGARVPEGSLGVVKFAPKSLTAAATSLNRKRGRPLKKGAVSGSNDLLRYGRGVNRGLDLTWQQEVFAAFGQVPELHYAINQVARSTAQALIVPDDSSATDGPEPPSTSATSPSRPENAIDEGTVYRAAQLANLVGEYYIVSYKNDPDPQHCEIFSPLELVWERDGTATLPRNWGLYNPNDRNSRLRVTRVHVPDAAIWERADSAPRAALPVLRELIGLTMYVSSAIDSTLTSAGILTYPASAEVSSGTTDNPGEHDDDVPLGDALFEAGTNALNNQGQAAAHMPVLVMIPDEFVGKGAVEHITFSTPLDAQASTLREELIKRLSVGLDVPVEVLAGMQNSASHFASWSVADDYVRMTISPLLTLITAGFEVHYDRKYTFDTSPLARRPNLAVEAVQLYDRGAISEKSLRYSLGFVDSDAPADPDADFEAAVNQKLWSIVKDSPSVLQTPGLPAVRAQIVAVFKGESPENSIYPGQAIAVSEDEVERGPGPNDDSLPGAPVPDRDEPRVAPPSARPVTQEPRSDGSPAVGSKGRRPNLPSGT